MQFPVLIEPVTNNGYRASSGAPLSLSADGATQEEALARLRQQFQERMSAGSRIVSLEVSEASHPLSEFAGIFKDDPHFDEVLRIMAENRRQRNLEPDLP
jgi:hypothetical protein